MKTLYHFLGMILAICLLVSVSVPVCAKGEWSDAFEQKIEDVFLQRDNLYLHYLEDNRSRPIPSESVILAADHFFEASPDTDIKVVDSFEGKKRVAVWGNSPDYASWNFQVSQEGLYRLQMTYFPIKQTLRSIELAVQLDGEFPFCEAASVTLKTAFRNEKPIAQDMHGNDYNSAQVEVSRWYTEPLTNETGLQDDPFVFYLSAGNHTLTVSLMQETLALGEIAFVPAVAPPSYQTYKEQQKTTAQISDCTVICQAENYSEKSHSSLMPVSDRSSTLNQPFSYSCMKFNVISGENWTSAGQWLQWEIEVPQTGWYQIGFRYSQSYNKNLPVHRRLYIDGEIPFAEADCFALPYEDDWGFYSLNVGGKDASILLTEGVHTVRLEAVMGEIQEIVTSVDEVVYRLSNIYQRINMIVGASPDQFRDYNLDKSIPGMIDTFRECSVELKNLREKLNVISGGKGTTAGIMDVLSYQLDDFIKSPSGIPTRAETFNSNISGLSSAGEELKSQAMDIDYLMVYSPDTKKPRTKDGLFRSLTRSVRMFLSSFVNDYRTFAACDEEESITVWVNSGRDQAQVLNRLINDNFVPSSGIPVKLKLVDATLIQAFLSGNPPDSMIMMSRGQPVNLAIRGALADLSKMPGFDTVKQNFNDGALLPYCFNDGCYALPDSQSFFMMFYRKDILNQLGLQVPQTWDDLYDVMQVLQVNNLDIGLPYAGISAAGAVDAGLSSTSIFSALLLQNGGQFYSDDCKKTALASPQAAKAFSEWTDFYTDYSLVLSYDFFNRFRTGVMPIGIASYTMYNQIYVAAPEIRNLWAMAPIPGTLREDGTTDRSQGGAGTACVMISTSAKKDAAWKFLTWWTGAEAQTNYAADIESALGMASRYATANVEAFGNIQWSRSEFKSLSEQWDEVCEIPEIPGSYYTIRGIDNAFRSVILNGKNPKETLVKYSREIDEEIARKRGEFALDQQ